MEIKAGAMRVGMAFVEFWSLVVIAAGVILAALPAPRE
jgi:hypothetical protein